MNKNGNRIQVKELEEDFINDSFFETLSNLAEVDAVSKDVFEEIKKSNNIKIFVAFIDRELVGTITALIEQKFIHKGGKVCHLEDLATRKGYENLGVGSILIEHVIKFATEEHCYKVILDCSKHNLTYYKKFGFYEHEISMRYDIPKSN
ncbi:MAG TPA: GNAT family N-acetyltransferase [Nitrososphaeraceae archaeon]|nr:GNAT family N-acetyltransferase [Nitrososphaeraceae archaeon]